MENVFSIWLKGTITGRSFLLGISCLSLQESSNQYQHKNKIKRSKIKRTSLNVVAVKAKIKTITFLTPRTFLALFFRSFICFLDFSTFVSNPFCKCCSIARHIILATKQKLQPNSIIKPTH
uniref:40S ribosomal protein S24 n=1 Tax=Solanum tuberosum TaxID=4113 RepID=M1BRZ0_SOLTU